VLFPFVHIQHTHNFCASHAQRDTQYIAIQTL